MIEADQWNKKIAQLPGAHILQTWEWGTVKSQTGWKAIPLEWNSNAAALVLKRSIPVGGLAARLSILYVPRGPVLDWEDTGLRRQVLDELEGLARKEGAIFIKIDPDIVIGHGIPEIFPSQDAITEHEVQKELHQRGWFFSKEQVQFRNTIWVDVNMSDKDLLARMKQKTRYNLRLAQKKGVHIRQGSLNDLSLLYRMYSETSVRDGFVIRPEHYYQTVWRTFVDREMAEILIAEVEGEPVAGLIFFYFAGKAWYLYGMSRAIHREKMPNYLLQWEAMRRARDLGAKIYDLWGAPDIFAESDSMWNVYRFKEGLGGKVIRTLGAWDYAPQSWLYAIYTRLLPQVLNVLRRRGIGRTRHEIGM